MPYHTDAKTKKRMDGVKANSVEKKIANKRKPKAVKMFENMPPNSHKMPDGTIMSGKSHSKDSKMLGKLAPAKGKAKGRGAKGKAPTKGSAEMKAKMARLRAMRKKK